MCLIGDDMTSAIASHLRKSKAALILFSAAAVSGCVDNSSYHAALPLPDGYQKLVPVNFIVYPGEMIGRYGGIVLDHAQEKILNSGLFSAIEAGPGPSPITFRVELSMICPLSPGEFVGALVLGAGTMFVVPHPETCQYTVDTEFYQPNLVISHRSYTVSYTKIIQMGINDQPHGDGLGFDQALEKMVADFAVNPPIPRAAGSTNPNGEVF